MKIKIENPNRIEAGVEFQIVVLMEDDKEIARFVKQAAEDEYKDKDFMNNLAGNELVNLRLNRISNVEVSPLPQVEEKAEEEKESKIDTKTAKIKK